MLQSSIFEGSCNPPLHHTSRLAMVTFVFAPFLPTLTHHLNTFNRPLSTIPISVPFHSMISSPYFMFFINICVLLLFPRFNPLSLFTLHFALLGPCFSKACPEFRCRSEFERGMSCLAYLCAGPKWFGRETGWIHSRELGSGT